MVRVTTRTLSTTIHTRHQLLLLLLLLLLLHYYFTCFFSSFSPALDARAPLPHYLSCPNSRPSPQELASSLALQSVGLLKANTSERQPWEGRLSKDDRQYMCRSPVGCSRAGC
jgi:hypothetical protein